LRDGASTLLKPLNKEHAGFYPKSIIEFPKDKEKLHPTQKPVALIEYLIRTYTKENEIVMDNCMGSGTTGVACVNLDRKFIGIELKEQYFNIAKERIEKAEKEHDK
jgi:DNA modification methylase